MEILDAQVHTWLADRPSRPWDPEFRLAHRRSVSHLVHASNGMPVEWLLVEMAEAGVDGAVLTPVGVYGHNLGYELEAAERFPRKFTVMATVDHLSPQVGDDLRHLHAQGVTSIRLLGMRDSDRLKRDEFRSVLTACADLRMCVAVSIAHPVDAHFEDLVREFANITFLLDHLGLDCAPPLRGAVPDEPFTNLPGVLRLAAHPNVCVKLTGAPALSRQTYPFRDLWSGLRKLIWGFGPQRVVWGSDVTRTNSLHSYWSGVHYLAEMGDLDDTDLASVYGQNLRRLLGWVEPGLTEPSRRFIPGDPGGGVDGRRPR